MKATRIPKSAAARSARAAKRERTPAREAALEDVVEAGDARGRVGAQGGGGEVVHARGSRRLRGHAWQVAPGPAAEKAGPVSGWCSRRRS